MFAQIDALQNDKPQYILTESLPPQHATLAEIATAAGYSQRQEQDFIQVFTIG
jgi:hypothetical protein